MSMCRHRPDADGYLYFYKYKTIVVKNTIILESLGRSHDTNFFARFFAHDFFCPFLATLHNLEKVAEVAKKILSPIFSPFSVTILFARFTLPR